MEEKRPESDSVGMRTEKREKVKEREDLRVLSLKRVKERQTNIVSHGKQKRIYIYIYIGAMRKRACFLNIFIGKQAIENTPYFY